MYRLDTVNSGANDAVVYFTNSVLSIPPQADGSCEIMASNGTALMLDDIYCSSGIINNLVTDTLGKIFDVLPTANVTSTAG